MPNIRRLFRKHRLESTPWELAGVILLAALLFVCAGAGMAYISGFHAFWEVLRRPRWAWLGASAGAQIISLAGYAAGYRGISKVERGPDLQGRPLLAVVVAGFSGLLAQGSGALDRYAMKAMGAGDREASARVAALTGLEHGSMPWIVCPTAVALWLIGVTKPPPSFVIPWAVIPPIGFALGIWTAERWRDRLRGRAGWRGKLGTFFDGTHYIWVLLSSPISCSAPLLGMLFFWGASMFSLWAGVAAFGLHMPAGTLIICYGTAYLATQRTAPLGGGGLLMTALVPTLWYVGGVPLAVATAGVLIHRLFSLWLFLPLSLAELSTLRKLGSRRPGTLGPGTAETHGEPALQH
jgi:uncharacterized membrane protein YbhN (UPF0104 family)